MTTPATLVIGPAWVGDMVMAQSLLMRLHEREPERPIDVLAPAWTRPLLERMPEVRAALELPFGHGERALRRRWRLGRGLRGRYARALVLPNSWKSALPAAAARIPERIGYRGEARYGLLTEPRRLDRARLPMTVQRFVALAEPAGADCLDPVPRPRLRIDARARDAALVAHGLDAARAPVLALCPGAEYGPAKRWPAAHFAAVARAHLQAGWQVWLFGSVKDGSACAELDRHAGGGCVDLSGRTTLAECCDLLSLAQRVVSNDSGLMHVAAALGRPLVALYGSSDPGFTPPLGEQAQVLRLGLACSPCFARECPLGHTDCLRQLEPARVLAALGAP